MIQTAIDLALAQLQSGIQGELLTGPACAPYAADFGGVTSRQPLVVVRASCEEDVVHTLKTARAFQIPVSLRGAGHSCGGQSLSAGGIVLVNFSGQPAFRLLPAGQVEVSARTSWYDLETGLNEMGRSVPVLPDYLNLSVGGTLSVGGYGRRSLVAGAQVDQVERLRLIAFDGAAIWCSRTENRELFRRALAGLGQAGAIETAVLRTVPYRPVSALHAFHYQTARELAEALAWLVEWQGDSPAQFQAVLGPGQQTAVFGIEGERREQVLFQPLPAPLRGRPADQTVVVQDAHLKNHEHISRMYAAPGCCHPWVDYFFDYEGLCRFLELLAGKLTAPDLAPWVSRANILAVRSSPEQLDSPRRAGSPHERTTRFLIGLYPRVPAKSAALPEVLAAVQALTDASLALGGRPYLHGWYRLSEETQRQLSLPLETLSVQSGTG